MIRKPLLTMMVVAVAVALAGCVSPEDANSGTANLDAGLAREAFSDPEASVFGARLAWCGFCAPAGFDSEPDSEGIIVYENGRVARVRFNFEPQAGASMNEIRLRGGVSYSKGALADALEQPRQLQNGTFYVHNVTTYRMTDGGASFKDVVNRNWMKPENEGVADCVDCGPRIYGVHKGPAMQWFEVYRVNPLEDFSHVAAAFNTVSQNMQSPPRA